MSTGCGTSNHSKTVVVFSVQDCCTVINKHSTAFPFCPSARLGAGRALDGGTKYVPIIRFLRSLRSLRPQNARRTIFWSNNTCQSPKLDLPTSPACQFPEVGQVGFRKISPVGEHPPIALFWIARSLILSNLLSVSADRR